MTKEAKTFNQGLKLAQNDIEPLLQKNKPITTTVSGKIGAGKTEFAKQLQKYFSDRGVKTAIIRTDDYFRQRLKPTDDIEHDTEKLRQNITNWQKENPVKSLILIEGLATEEESIGQKPDYKIRLTTNFEERITRKIIRDEKENIRTAAESLKFLRELAVKNPGAVIKNETEAIIPDLNLLVHNDYRQESGPKLFVKKNTLTFTINKKIRESLKLDTAGEEAAALKNIGLTIL